MRTIWNFGSEHTVLGTCTTTSQLYRMPVSARLVAIAPNGVSCCRGLTDVTPHNIKQLKKLNSVVFPITYTDKVAQISMYTAVNLTFYPVF